MSGFAALRLCGLAVEKLRIFAADLKKTDTYQPVRCFRVENCKPRWPQANAEKRIDEKNVNP